MPCLPLKGNVGASSTTVVESEGGCSSAVPCGTGVQCLGTEAEGGLLGAGGGTDGVWVALAAFVGASWVVQADQVGGGSVMGGTDVGIGGVVGDIIAGVGFCSGGVVGSVGRSSSSVPSGCSVAGAATTAGCSRSAGGGLGLADAFNGWHLWRRRRWCGYCLRGHSTLSGLSG